MLTSRTIIRHTLLVFLSGNFLLALLLAFMLINGSGGSTLAIGINLVFYVAFLVAAFSTIVRRKHLVLLPKILIGLLFTLWLVIVGILISGLIQDMSGQQCSGLWGVDTACIGNSWFIVAIILGYTLMTFAPALFFAAAIAVQLRANANPRATSLKRLLDRTK